MLFIESNFSCQFKEKSRLQIEYINHLVLVSEQNIKVDNIKGIL